MTTLFHFEQCIINIPGCVINTGAKPEKRDTRETILCPSVSIAIALLRHRYYTPGIGNSHQLTRFTRATRVVRCAFSRKNYWYII